MFAVFSMARKSLVKGFIVLSMVALASCQTVPTGRGVSINTNAPVPVALLVPSGSGQASDELLAQSLENAARLAISDLDGVRIDLRVYSTAGQPATAAAAATRAVDEGARIILGPVFAQAANAAGVAVAGRGVNVLSFSNNTDIAGGNVFVLGPTFQNTAMRLVNYSVSQGRRNVMIVHDKDAAGEAGRAAIQRATFGSGASVVAAIAYERSQSGVVTAAPEVLATQRSTEADAVFLTATTDGALPLLTQLLKDNGVNTSAQIIGLTRWDIPQAVLSLPGVQNGWFALPDPAPYDQFQSRFMAAFGQTPHPIAGLAYDGIAAIGALVRQGNSDALTASALTQANGFVGVSGIFRLRPDGTNERGLAIAQVRNNQVIVIDAAPRAFGGGGF